MGNNTVNVFHKRQHRFLSALGKKMARKSPAKKKVKTEVKKQKETGKHMKPLKVYCDCDYNV